MAGKTITKIILLLSAIVAFALVLGVCVYQERNHCMGISFLEEKDVVYYKKIGGFDLDNLTFNGQKVAYDKGSQTVYLSQSADNIDHYYNLQGQLQWNDPDSEMFFIKDKNFMNLAKSVKDNEPLQLYITNGERHMLLKVVISTLPIVRIEGEVDHKNEDDR